MSQLDFEAKHTTGAKRRKNMQQVLNAGKHSTGMAIAYVTANQFKVRENIQLIRCVKNRATAGKRAKTRAAQFMIGFVFTPD